MALTLINLVLWTTGLAALAVSAIVDLRARYLPNQLVAVVAATGIMLNLISRPGQIWISLLIAVAILVALGVAGHFRIIGGGDVKLMAASTLIVPPQHVVGLLLAIVLAGGVLSLVYLGAHMALRRTPAPADLPKNGALPDSQFHQFLRDERARMVTGRSVPYGIAIFAGVATYVASEARECFYAICS